MKKRKNIPYLSILKGVIFACLIVIVFSLAFRGIKSACGFHKIDKDSIEYAVVYRHGIRSSDSIVLTQKQISKLTSRWNNALPLGICIYVPQFIILMKTKAGKIRHFSIYKNNIKESDFGYSLIGNVDFLNSQKSENQIQNKQLTFNDVSPK